MDKMREEFEKDYGELYLQTDGDGEYAGYHAKTAWEYWKKSWKASRAALVVELPEYVADSAIRNKAIDEFKIKLDNAGIKYE